MKRMRFNTTKISVSFFSSNFEKQRHSKANAMWFFSATVAIVKSEYFRVKWRAMLQCRHNKQFTKRFSFGKKM